MSRPGLGSSEPSSRRRDSSVSSSKASRPEPFLLCPLDSVRRDWESGRLMVYGKESDPFGVLGGELVGSGSLGGN